MLVRQVKVRHDRIVIGGALAKNLCLRRVPATLGHDVVEALTSEPVRRVPTATSAFAAPLEQLSHLWR